MRRLTLFPLLVVAAFAIAACGGSGATTGPDGGGASPPAASAGGGASPPAASAGGGGAPCATADAGAAAAKIVEISGSTFTTDPVSISVGDVVAWANVDGVPHTATLDDGACDTGSIAGGATGVLVFNEAGTYPYHCNIHSGMKGTIEVQ